MNHEEREHLNKLVTNREIDHIILKFSKKKIPSAKYFFGEYYKILKESQYFKSSFRNRGREKRVPAHAMRSWLLWNRPFKDTTRKESCRPAYPKNSDMGPLNKMLLVKWLRQHIKSIRYHDKWGLTQECKFRLTSKTNKCNIPYFYSQEKKIPHTITPIDAEKALYKTQHTFVIKSLRKVTIKWKF